MSPVVCTLIILSASAAQGLYGPPHCLQVYICCREFVRFLFCCFDAWFFWATNLAVLEFQAGLDWNPPASDSSVGTKDLCCHTLFFCFVFSVYGICDVCACVGALHVYRDGGLMSGVLTYMHTQCRWSLPYALRQSLLPSLKQSNWASQASQLGLGILSLPPPF